MRKNLFALGLLAFSFSANSQILTYVGDGGTVYVSPNTLVYSGGTVQTVGTGVIDNSGNIMIDQGGGFYTKAADGTTDKIESDTHGNLILRLTETASPYSTYGQLWIQTSDQGIVKGFVDKEYLDGNNGSYQQIAMPFSQKTIKTIGDEFGFTVSNSRWSQNEVLTWNNGMARSDHFARMNLTPYNAAAVTKYTNIMKVSFYAKPYSYYMIGAKDFDANAPAAAIGSVYTLHGVPYASGNVATMANAAASVDFGTNGYGKNAYTEWYNTYLQDSWAVTDGETWTGNYGRNIYQYGNPYLTNLDFSQIHISENGTNDDNTNITNIVGVRYEGVFKASSLKFGISGGSTSASYVTFPAGVPTGDVGNIIKPMQAFAIKLSSPASSTIDFDHLRRFSNVARGSGESYSVTAAKLAGTKTKSTSKVSSSTVKQIGVIGLDADGYEVGRTYYVVYSNGVTGHPSAISTQVAASNTNTIGTFEEKAEGGVDADYKDAYWLYINEANEEDFKGKEIPLSIFSEDIKSLKFEIRENAKLIDTNSSLTNGESFYILDSSTGSPVAVSQGDVLSLSSTQLGLYYGQPIVDQVLDTDKNLSKPSQTVIVYDSSDDKYKVLFDPSWNKASVTVHDMSGKLISDVKEINTENSYSLSLPSVKTVYVVTATSETGKKFVQRIKN